MYSTYGSQEKWSFLVGGRLNIVGEIGEQSVYSVLVHTAQLLYNLVLKGLDQSFALFVYEHSPGGLAVGVK